MFIAKVITSLKDEGKMAMVCQGTFIGWHVYLCVRTMLKTVLICMCVLSVIYFLSLLLLLLLLCSGKSKKKTGVCMQAAAVVPSFKIIMCMLYVHLYL